MWDQIPKVSHTFMVQYKSTESKVLDDEQPTDKQGPRKRTRTSTHDDPSEEWFPWHDKIVSRCI